MNPSIPQKLAKIIKLADHGSDGEKDNALAKAQAIAAEHGIDLAYVRVQAQQSEAAERPEEIVRQHVEVNYTDPTYAYIGGILQNYFDTYIIFSGRKAVRIYMV